MPLLSLTNDEIKALRGILENRTSPSSADETEKSLLNKVATLDENNPGIWRHKKRGTRYEIIGKGMIQVDGPLDEATGIVYRDIESGKIFHRLPESEFYDGRFEKENEGS